MKVKDIKGLSTAEMLEKEKEFKEELFNLRFQHPFEKSPKQSVSLPALPSTVI